MSSSLEETKENPLQHKIESIVSKYCGAELANLGKIKFEEDLIRQEQLNIKKSRTKLGNISTAQSFEKAYESHMLAFKDALLSLKQKRQRVG